MNSDENTNSPASTAIHEGENSENQHTDQTVNNPGQHGNVPLHNAVIENDEGMLSNLLQHGCIDLNLKNSLGFTPLLLAIKINRPYSFIMQFVHLSADLNATDIFGRNSLHMALLSDGDEKVLHELKKNGANINAHDYEGCTALHLAIKRNQPIAFDLIRAGADVNCITYDNQNLLEMCLMGSETNLGLFELIWPKFNYHLLLNAETPFLYTFMSFHPYSFSACEWLKSMYLVLNCPVLFELLDHYRKYSADYNDYCMFDRILPVFTNLNIKLCDRLNIISILLSLGTEIDVYDINLVLILYGFNEELEMFLYCTDNYAKHDFGHLTLLPQCSFIFSTDDPNIKTVIQLFKHFLDKMVVYACAYIFDIGSYKALLGNCILNNLGFFSVSSELKAELINYCRNDVILEYSDYAPAVIDKINRLPEFPSLVELSRNQARKCIMQTFKITKAYQFHDIVKKLKLPNIIRDILRFKTPLY